VNNADCHVAWRWLTTSIVHDLLASANPIKIETLLHGDSKLDRVIRCVNQILPRPEVTFGGLHGSMSQQ